MILIRPDVDEPLLVVRELDEKVMHCGAHGSVGNRAGMRQMLASLSLSTTLATPHEIKFLKECEVIGRRAPAVALLPLSTATHVMRSVKREKNAKELEMAWMAYKLREVNGQLNEQEKPFSLDVIVPMVDIDEDYAKKKLLRAARRRKLAALEKSNEDDNAENMRMEKKHRKSRAPQFRKNQTRIDVTSMHGNEIRRDYGEQNNRMGPMSTAFDHQQLSLADATTSSQELSRPMQFVQRQSVFLPNANYLDASQADDDTRKSYMNFAPYSRQTTGTSGLLRDASFDQFPIHSYDTSSENTLAMPPLPLSNALLASAGQKKYQHYNNHHLYDYPMQPNLQRSQSSSLDVDVLNCSNTTQMLGTASDLPAAKHVQSYSSMFSGLDDNFAHHPQDLSSEFAAWQQGLDESYYNEALMRLL